jgi:uncharacterized membrane protein (UPF0127 family)
MNEQTTRRLLGWCCGLALLAGVCAGCNKEADAGVNLAVDPTEPREAQPKLQTMKIFIGPTEMNAELALRPTEIRTGMMFRTNRLAEKEGMLFALPQNQQASFWMKNCPVSLSAAYIDPEGIIREIHLLQANNTNPVVAGSDKIRFVLETSEGWFERHHIQPGTAVATERGPLMDSFFPNR